MSVVFGIKVRNLTLKRLFVAYFLKWIIFMLWSMQHWKGSHMYLVSGYESRFQLIVTNFTMAWSLGKKQYCQKILSKEIRSKLFWVHHKLQYNCLWQPSLIMIGIISAHDQHRTTFNHYDYIMNFLIWHLTVVKTSQCSIKVVFQRVTLLLYFYFFYSMHIFLDSNAAFLYILYACALLFLFLSFSLMR